MPNYPSIRKGLGKLDPQLWTRIMLMLAAFEKKQEKKEVNISSTRNASGGMNRPYFLAKITDSAEIEGTENRYEYTFEEVVLDGTTGFAARPNGRTGDNALNLCEMSNTATHVGAGVDLEGASYPEGFSMMPIGECGDGDEVHVVVVIFGVRDSDGALRSAFCLGNTHDGTCNE